MMNYDEMWKKFVKPKKVVYTKYDLGNLWK